MDTVDRASGRDAVMRCDCLSAARCRSFAYFPADASAALTSTLASLSPEWFAFLVSALRRLSPKEAVKRVLLLLIDKSREREREKRVD